MTRRAAAVLSGLAAACLVLSGCGIGMPDSGPVHETSATGSNRDDSPVNIDPPRPEARAPPPRRSSAGSSTR